jgi:glutaredoxin 3
MSAKVEIYSSANCAFCVAAKNLLKARGFDYQEVRIDTEAGKREEMVARSHRRTVPQIFVNGEHIGGFDDLAEADRSGRLAQLVAVSGAAGP